MFLGPYQLYLNLILILAGLWILMPLITTTSALMYLTSITEGVCLGLTRGNISLNYSFSSKDFKDKKSDKDSDDQTFRNGGRQDDLFGDNTTRFGDNTFEDDDNQDTTKSNQ